MKKRFLGSVTLGMLLLANANASVERIGGFAGFDAIEEHSQEASASSYEDMEKYEDEDRDKKSEEEEKSELSSIGMAEIVSSAMGNTYSSYSSAKNEAYEEYSSAKEEAHDYYSSAMSSAYSSYSSAKSEAYEEYSSTEDKTYEAVSSEFQNENTHWEQKEERVERLMHVIEEAMHSKDVPTKLKEVAHQVQQAIEFYKKEELFADLNISDLKECNETCLNTLSERAREAYEERKQELAQKVLKHRNRVEYKVAGYFVKTGEGQYDWAFVLPNGEIYQLTGVDATGHFKYEKVEGKAQITATGYVYLPGTVSGEGLPFINYGDPEENGFDWVIVAGDGSLYKLEGYDQETQSFVYTPVEGVVAEAEGEDEVVLLPGT